VRRNLQRYRGSVLKAAVEGRLTEKWRAEHPGAEPASELLKRILAERRKRWEADQLAKFRAAGKQPPKGWQSKYAEPAAPDTPHLPALPQGWCWAAVEQLGTLGEQPVLTGPFGSTLGTEDFVQEGVPLLTIGCLTEQGVALEKAFYVTPGKADQLRRYRVRNGDLLFSRSASVGRAGLVTASLDGCLINYHLMRLRLAEEAIDPRYFIYYVRGSGSVVAYLREVNHGATRDGINTENLLAMPVALPPRQEQEAVVDEVESRLSEGHSLDRVAADSGEKADRLRQSILKRAFEGRLVPQDPSDEPAHVLLARIGAGRAGDQTPSARSKPGRRNRRPGA
jgi:type I restriction enzyme S subunit